MLWSNGGPGCSGLIGFFTEHGPFSPLSDGQNLQTNYDNSWNQLVNMLYIEAPAGVGFSYSNVNNDYTVGDARTAADNYEAILVFLERFPQFNASDFYISSESYGGHYMPTLALAIVEGNAAGQNPTINFKGVLVGNPFTDPFENDIGSYGTWFGHGLISQITWNGLDAHCFQQRDAECSAWKQTADNEVGNVDPYALDYPVCLSSRAEPIRLLEALNRTHLIPRYPYDPCRDEYTTAYVNQGSVIAAIHANPNLAYKWSECSSFLQYNQTDLNNRMEPLWVQLVAAGSLHLTIFSGDDDSVCGLMGTQAWMFNLGLPVVETWAPWIDASGQVGGYRTVFAGIKLVTVHSAGHMVPSFQPQRALQLLQRYLSGEF